MPLDALKQELINSFEQNTGPAIADLEARLRSLRSKRADDVTLIERKVEHCIAGFLNVVPLCTTSGDFAMASNSAEGYIFRLESIEGQMSEDINPLDSVRRVAHTLETLAARL